MSERTAIEAGNKIIAEFMGGRYKEVFWGGKPEKCFYMPNSHISEPIRDFKESMPYHTSWDLLMPVVEKIASNNPDHEVEIEIGKTFATFKIRDLDDGHSLYGINEYDDADKPMQAIYKGVVRYIEWYNQNKAKT